MRLRKETNEINKSRIEYLKIIRWLKLVLVLVLFFLLHMGMIRRERKERLFLINKVSRKKNYFNFVQFKFHVIFTPFWYRF